MNTKQKEVYEAPMLVKHGLLRDITEQFDELLQLERRLVVLKPFPTLYTPHASRLAVVRALRTIVAVLCLGVMLSTFVPSFALGYRPMCASDTNALKMAALELETAQLRFQRAQTNYQRTCGSHGLSRDDEFACGQFGHAREEYRHTAKLLDLAKNRFRSSNRSAASSCSVSVEDTPSLRALKKVAPGE